VERSFAILKNKWRILGGIPNYHERTQTGIIIACVALHNFVRQSNLPDIDFDMFDQNEDFVPDDNTQSESVESTSVGTGDENCMNYIREQIADSVFASRH